VVADIAEQKPIRPRPAGRGAWRQPLTDPDITYPDGNGPPLRSFVSLASMGRRLRSQLFNRVLEGQLASLQIDDFEVVDGGMVHRGIEFALDIAMLPLQLVKMVGKRHDWGSLS
jgi:hypothetical protein